MSRKSKARTTAAAAGTSSSTATAATASTSGIAAAKIKTGRGKKTKSAADNFAAASLEVEMKAEDAEEEEGKIHFSENDDDDDDSTAAHESEEEEEEEEDEPSGTLSIRRPPHSEDEDDDDDEEEEDDDDSSQEDLTEDDDEVITPRGRGRGVAAVKTVTLSPMTPPSPFQAPLIGRLGISDGDDQELNRLASRRTKKRKPGIVYLSSIPPTYNVSQTTMYFSQFGQVGRVFLQPDAKEKAKSKDNMARRFTEGWVEFASKRAAKEVATRLNNSAVGGKKRSKAHDVIWNIKYLPRFKWSHLSERLAYEKAVHQQKMRTEISQAKREADFFKTNVEKSKRIEKAKKRNSSKLHKADSAEAAKRPRVYEFRQKETDDAIRKRKTSGGKQQSKWSSEDDGEEVSPPKQSKKSPTSSSSSSGGGAGQAKGKSSKGSRSNKGKGKARQKSGGGEAAGGRSDFLKNVLGSDGGSKS